MLFEKSKKREGAPFIKEGDFSNNYSKFGIIIIFLFFISMMIATIVVVMKSHKVKMETQFEGTYSYYFQQRGDVHLKLNEYSYFWKTKTACNYDYKPISLRAFLQKGDLVKKNRCSDTLIIQRGKKVFHFLLEDYNYNYISKHPEQQSRKDSKDKREIVLNSYGCK